MTINPENQPVITRQLAIYDPRSLSEEDFLNSFVGRHDKLGHLVRQIRSFSGENRHHLLIFGSRGMGKTSMLLRIAIAISQDETLRRQWIPVTFREEQYNVRQLRFFWQNACDSVAEWCEQAGDDGNATRLDQAREGGADEDDLWALLSEVSRRHGARLLLLVDNLDLILENLPESEQWSLRHTLSRPDGPMMIATTTQLIKALTRREAPFYDFFRLQDLQPLSAAELRTCLTRIAATRAEAGKRVMREIGRQPARLQVLHVLTNGNPRTLFHIYQILESLNPDDENTPRSFMALLESLLDSVTPLYKARTEELTPQQRQILDAIALAWDPKNSAWIAEQTGLAATTLSPQIKRLRELGIIEKTPLASNKKGLQLRERFYNIWYLQRNGSRRGRSRLRFFTKFLVAWYSPAERDGMARGYLRTSGEKHHPDYSLALAAATENGGLQRALVQDATRSLLQRDAVLDDIIGSELDPVMVGRKQQQKSVASSLGKKNWKTREIDRFWELLSGSLYLSEKEKQQVIDSIDRLEQKQLSQLLTVFEEEITRFDKSLTHELSASIRQALQQGLIRDKNDIEGFLAVAEQTNNRAILLFPLLQAPERAVEEIPPDDVELVLAQLYDGHPGAFEDKDFWNNLGNLLQGHLSRYDEAEAAYRKAIELNPEYAGSWNNLGNLLKNHLSRYDETEAAYRKAIELDPEYAGSWNNLGNLLKNHLSRYDETEAAYRKAIELDPEYAGPWNGLGNLLQDHLSRYDEAEAAYRKAIELDPEYAWPWNNLGTLLQDHLSRYDEAEAAYRKAIKLDPEYAWPWNNLGTLLQDHLSRYDEAEAAYRRAMELDPDGLYPVGNLCWLAIRRGRLDEALQLRQELDALPGVGQWLLDSALVLARDNFGAAWALLHKALDAEEPTLWTTFRDDLLRLVRLFLVRKYGERLLEAMREAGFALTLAPLYHAVEASVYGDELLRNINPETRMAAEVIYRWLKTAGG